MVSTQYRLGNWGWWPGTFYNWINNPLTHFYVCSMPMWRSGDIGSCDDVSISLVMVCLVAIRPDLLGNGTMYTSLHVHMSTV